MPDSVQSIENCDLERFKLGLMADRYKAKLDFYKFVSGSVFAAITIVFIPPAFQYATSYLENQRHEKEQNIKQQQYKDQYIQSFLSNGISQDVELRIRFAQYFAAVSSLEARVEWNKYYQELVEQRDKKRREIDQFEAQWRAAAGAGKNNDTEVERLERNLNWLYKEIGYAEKNRSVTVNPRVPEQILTLPAIEGFDPNKYTVFVQFAGVIVRDDVRNMMRKLLEVGWRMQGADLGGERTPIAAKENEIRYRDKSDEVAAKALAQAVQAFNLTSQPVSYKENSNIQKGNLEVWISR